MAGSRRVRNTIIYLAYLLILAIAAIEGVVLFVAAPGRFCESAACWEEQWMHGGGHHPARDNFLAFDAALGWVSRGPFRTPDAMIGVNSAGMRGAREYSVRRSGSRTRVVALGDSFTFGECVGDDDTWSALLERKLPGGEVLNFGVNGYGVDQAVLRWEKEASSYAPDVVVMGFFAPDVERCGLSFWLYAKPRFVADNSVPDGLRLVGVPVLSPEAYQERNRNPLYRATRHLRLVAELVHGRLTHDGDRNQGDGSNDPPTVDVVARILRRLARGVKAAGARPIFLYLPLPSDVSQGGHPSGPMDQVCAEGVADCVDPTVAIRRFLETAPRPQKDYFACHYSPEINEVIAETLRTLIAP